MHSTGLYHLQINVSDVHAAFYREWFAWLGWETVFEPDIACGVRGPNGTYLWFETIDANELTNRDALGVNHVAIGATSIESVNAAAVWLGEQGISPLFDTPRRRPEFAANTGGDYYQLMFESPDGILFEFVFTG